MLIAPPWGEREAPRVAKTSLYTTIHEFLLCAHAQPRGRSGFSDFHNPGNAMRSPCAEPRHAYSHEETHTHYNAIGAGGTCSEAKMKKWEVCKGAVVVVTF